MRTEKANEKVKKERMYFIMKYVATLNGKKYEIEIERVEEYKPLDRGVTVNAPAPILATGSSSGSGPCSPGSRSGTCTNPRSGTCTGSSSGSRSSRRTVRRCSHAW